MSTVTLTDFIAVSDGEQVLSVPRLTAESEAFCIYGAPKSGKTAFALALCGYLKTSGSFTLFDREVTLPTEQRNFGMLFGECSVSRGSVEDAIGFGLKLRGADAESVAKRVREVAPIFGLQDRLAEPCKKLDVLTKQKVAFLRLYARKPALVVMDMPVRGESGEELGFLSTAIALCKEENIPVILLTESTVQAELCAEIGVLEKGRLTAFGRREVLRKDPPTLATAKALAKEYGEVYAEVKAGTLTVADRPLFGVDGEDGAYTLFCYENVATLCENGDTVCRIDYVEPCENGYRYYLDFALDGEEKDNRVTKFTVVSDRPPREGEENVALRILKENCFLFKRKEKSK